MKKNIRIQGRILKAAAFAIVVLCATITVYAQDAKTRYDFRIEGGKLGKAVADVHDQTNIEFIYSFDLADVDGIHPVKGYYTLEYALAVMFEGTGLSGGLTESGMIVITREKSAHAQIREQDMIHGKIKKGLLSTISALLFGVGGAHAQQSSVDQNTEAQEPAFDEIIVTATKRAQSLQDVPFGLSALTGANLERIGASGAEDYLAEIPGVHYNAQGRGTSPIVIRGISTEGATRNNLQNSTTIYIDDLPSLNAWGAWSNSDFSTFDLERVEVLRGPQGTLFGSGALGGAVRVITNKPDLSEFAAKIEYGHAFTHDGEDSYNLSAMVNVPIISDKLAIRAVGYKREDGGYIDNVRRDEKDVNSGSSEGGRLLLAYQATDRLSLRFTLTHEENSLDDSPASYALEAEGDAYEYNGTIPNASDIKLTSYNLYAEYEFDGFMVSSSTTYAERDSLLNTDYVSYIDSLLGGALGFDADAPTAYIDPDDHDYLIRHKYDTFAQELRLSSTHDGPFQWTIGGFYLKQNLTAYQLWASEPFGPVLESNYDVHVTETALFGEASYKFSDKFSVTIGARAFDNKFEFERIDQPSVFVPAGGAVTPYTVANSSSINPKFSVSYFPSEDIHLYATAAKGFRIGQVNFVQDEDVEAGITREFDPDSLWNYEAGIKASLFDNRLSLNAALFYIDWSDIQLQRFVTGPASGLLLNITDNAGKAEIKGLEADLKWRPTAGIEIGSAITVLDAKLKSVLDGVPMIPGSTLPGSADFSASNFIEFSSDKLPNDMRGYMRLGHRYVGESVSNINNAPQLYSDKYNVFNARAGLMYGGYEIIVYVDNLTNNDARTSNFGVDAQNLFASRSYRLQPRTIGVTMRADF
ncbi:TonB-dependent receptor [Kordiimonas pumila]|uniref:TonB-dependent receptor n=2 Tax=Kordiimonas pumila TaxID=2161677 RepID=A0ABV7CZU9_9PROT